MNPESPKITIIIPHYNMSAFLPRAVESVAGQQYENVEVIVVDDGSEETVNCEQLKVEGLKIKLSEIDHGGKAKAVNAGFKKATGAYLAILDADDRLPAKSISGRLEIMEKSGADLSIGSFQICYEGKIKTTRSMEKFTGQSNDQIAQALLMNIISPFHQNAMLFSRQLLERTGGMNPEMLRGQDKDFAARLLQQSKKTVLIKNPVYVYSRYDRPLSTRLYNRCVGMKYKLIVTNRHSKGWRRFVYLSWNILIEGAKLIHDLFGIYKR